MAQLNATVDQIQLTTNMIKSSDTKLWDDTNYPSAKAVTDIVDTKIAAIIPAEKFEHPIGSVLITSTNVSPASTIGGEWALFDKEYKNEYAAMHISQAWTASAATASGGITRANHEICIKVWLVTTAAVSNGTVLGNFSRTLVGVKDSGSFTLSNEGGIAYATGDNGESFIIRYVLNGGGELSVSRVFDNKTLPIGTTIHIHTIVPMTDDDMLDSFCDKFYWKRTK